MVLVLWLLLFSQLDQPTNASLVWQSCPYGQQQVGQVCSGEPLLMDQRSAKQLALEQILPEQTNWRLPSSQELKQYPRERLRDYDVQLLSSDHIAHGNEFMVITLNPQTGKLEYQPIHYRGLLLLIRD